MPKALKISGFSITEIECKNDGFIQDEEYKTHDRSWDAHGLYKPEMWGGKKFNLAFVCRDTFLREDTDFNILGTYLYRMLKHPTATLDDIIFGPFYLLNEDRDGIIDLTIDDLKYIFETAHDDRNQLNCSKMELMMKTYIAIKIKFPELA